ncbi:hypothetical protein [Candidatus Binatus sp.]|uniref:hypothetical protein n=1 Tax=Candidatus Binatus sp. TaxID=2811406 RepID=UPI002F94218F
MSRIICRHPRAIASLCAAEHPGFASPRKRRPSIKEVPDQGIDESAVSQMAGFSSAFLYIANLYRNRARVRVRLLEEQFYSQRPPGLRFEAENLGTGITSIEPIVRFHGLLPRPKGKRPIDGIKLAPYRLDFKIDESAQRTCRQVRPRHSRR